MSEVYPEEEMNCEQCEVVRKLKEDLEKAQARCAILILRIQEFEES